MSNKEIPNWEKEFKRAKNNSIYFLEMYYNKVHTDALVKLSDEDKQMYFDKYKGVPLVKSGLEEFKKFQEWHKKVEELKEKGHKDWEIF